MKKIFAFAVLINLITACYAQKELTAGIYTVENKRFRVKDGTSNPLTGPVRVIVSNPDYKYANQAPKLKVQYPIPMEKKDIHFDLEKVKSIVLEILKTKLPQLKENQERLLIGFSFEQDGALTDIDYILNKKTFISLEDIAKIDTKLKAEIKASFTGKEYLQYERISYNYPAIFF